MTGTSRDCRNLEKPPVSLPVFWSTYLRVRRNAPFLHPLDEAYLASMGYWIKHPAARERLTFAKYIRSARFGDLKNGEFHFSLQPAPYVGDLNRAVVLILLLNPGFAHGDYYAEYCNSGFRERLDANLRQDFSGTEFPFFFLDPSFCWTGGFQWWEGKLRRVIEELAERCFRSDYRRALQFTARRIASIELIPYHSTAFKELRWIEELPSARIARFAVTTLAQKARKRETCIVVTRQVAAWSLPKLGNRVVCYSPAEARGAHLTPESKGGKIILRRLEAAYHGTYRQR